MDFRVRRIVVGLFLVAICFAMAHRTSTPLCADDSTPGSEAAKTEPPKQALITRLKWMQFFVVNGHLEPRYIRRSQNRSVTVNHHESDSQEHAAIRMSGANLRITYQLSTPNYGINVEYVHPNNVTIIHTQHNDDELVTVLSQTPDNLLVVKQQNESWESDHLWLLLLSIPRDVRNKVIDMVTFLTPDSQVQRKAEQIESELVRVATSDDERIDIPVINQLVEQLRSKSFVERQSADAELRKMGNQISGYLAELDQQRLSAEQRLRIRRICQTSTPRMMDSSTLVITWLKNAPSTWFALSQHPNRDVRIASSRQLNLMFDVDIKINPDSSPSSRKVQIADFKAASNLR